MKQFLRNNALSLVTVVLFVVFVFGQSLVGLRQYNEEQQQHNEASLTYSKFIGSGEFIETVFENWESEFLQMFAFVLLTVWLKQKGSPESKKISGENPEEQEPKQSNSRKAPWAVRRGGAILKLYSHSLSIAFLLLFLLSFSLHAYGGAQATCEENLEHGEKQCQTTFGYMTTSKFWYESLQNWQSEFLAVASIVWLSVYLREKGSPESKPVNTPHAEHGE